ncbi:hypothetical protein [Bythopirellula polymerisocia]|uniref:Uncharacterized protein n=1 Tax=Bythopirellula polymerisocia TaxID=2528003 RepID=A0A5C6D310_9BACT|nr:hypothetical protein [Bythopirellula polymerisocia]TWU30244.1 hypothetical protein Pla144_10300 [Bythopirellula polymerisocia]
MRILLQLVSAIALIATILPSIMFLTGSLDLTQTKLAMLIASVVWFIATPLWMGQPPEQLEHEEIVL